MSTPFDSTTFSAFSQRFGHSFSDQLSSDGASVLDWAPLSLRQHRGVIEPSFTNGGAGSNPSAQNQHQQSQTPPPPPAPPAAQAHQGPGQPTHGLSASASNDQGDQHGGGSDAEHQHGQRDRSMSTTPAPQNGESSNHHHHQGHGHHLMDSGAHEFHRKSHTVVASHVSGSVAPVAPAARQWFLAVGKAVFGGGSRAPVSTWDTPQPQDVAGKSREENNSDQSKGKVSAGGSDDERVSYFGNLMNVITCVGPNAPPTRPWPFRAAITATAGRTLETTWTPNPAAVNAGAFKQSNSGRHQSHTHGSSGQEQEQHVQPHAARHHQPQQQGQQRSQEAVQPTTPHGSDVGTPQSRSQSAFPATVPSPPPQSHSPTSASSEHHHTPHHGQAHQAHHGQSHQDSTTGTQQHQQHPSDSSSSVLAQIANPAWNPFASTLINLFGGKRSSLGEPADHHGHQRTSDHRHHGQGRDQQTLVPPLFSTSSNAVPPFDATTAASLLSSAFSLAIGFGGAESETMAWDASCDISDRALQAVSVRVASPNGLFTSLARVDRSLASISSFVNVCGIPARHWPAVDMVPAPGPPLHCVGSNGAQNGAQNDAEENGTSSTPGSISNGEKTIEGGESASGVPRPGQLVRADTKSPCSLEREREHRRRSGQSLIPARTPFFLRAGLGLTARHDEIGAMAFGGAVAEIGRHTTVAFHADPLRRFCTTVTTRTPSVVASVRLSANAITWRDTALDFGVLWHALAVDKKCLCHAKKDARATLTNSIDSDAAAPMTQDKPEPSIPMPVKERLSLLDVRVAHLARQGVTVGIECPNVDNMFTYLCRHVQRRLERSRVSATVSSITSELERGIGEDAVPASWAATAAGAVQSAYGAIAETVPLRCQLGVAVPHAPGAQVRAFAIFTTA